MISDSPIPFKGSPGSPYTRKMLAVLRYRHIPYELLMGGHDNDFGMPRAKVELLPTFYMNNAQGEIEAVVDSTPIIRRLELEFPYARSIIPDNTVLDFINALLEDYGDEWLTKAMFHYRWHYQADRANAGNMLPRWGMLGESEESIKERNEYFTDRQVNRLYVVGSNDRTAPVIEASYRRFLDIMDKLIQQHPFLLGDRPSSADFAFYGQLTQLAQFDPTPRELTMTQAPRIYAWVDVVDDLSGLRPESTDWLNVEEASRMFRPLLTEVGRTYVPVMLANAKAMNEGAKLVETTVEGEAWEQQAFPYQARCVAELRSAFARLEEAERDEVVAILEGTGCEKMFS